jgi:hypothetical protein
MGKIFYQLSLPERRDLIDSMHNLLGDLEREFARQVQVPES